VGIGESEMIIKELLEEIELLKKRCPDTWQMLEIKTLYLPQFVLHEVLHVKSVHRNYNELALILESAAEKENRTGIHDISIG
jgi:hypothetical protein